MSRFWKGVALSVLILLLATLAALVWLVQSGRLAQLSEALLKRLSGQEVRIGTVSFASWNTVVLSDVRLVQAFSGWQLRLACPRVEARYGLLGLLRGEVHRLVLREPELALARQAAASSPAAAAPPAAAPTALPIRRLELHQATLHLPGATLAPLTLTAAPDPQGRLRLAGEGKWQGAALRFTGQVALAAPQPAGTLALHFAALSLAALPHAVPALQGEAAGRLELTWEGPELRGELTATLSSLAPGWPALRLQEGKATAQLAFRAELAQGQGDAQGELALEAAQAAYADLLLQPLTLKLPLQLAYRGGDWQARGEVQLRGQPAAGQGRLAGEAFSLQLPLALRFSARGLAGEGEARLKAEGLRLAVPGGAVQLSTLEATLPLRGTPAALEIPQGRLALGAWQWRRGEAVQRFAGLTLRASATLAPKRLALHAFSLALPALGTLEGRATLDWPPASAHQVRLQWQGALPALWPHLAPLLPPAYRAWQVQGRSRVVLEAPRLRWPPAATPLALSWHWQEGGFASPQGTHAAEHLDVTLQASLSLDPQRHALQGTLTLAPFSLLLGPWFPALEANAIASVLTFSGLYDPQGDALELYLAGQLRHLGTVTLQGTVQQALRRPRLALRLNLRQFALGPAWRTALHDPVLFPTLARLAVSGTLNAEAELAGTPPQLALQGHLDLDGVSLEGPSLALHEVSLLLPLRLTYPLPPPLDRAALAAAPAGHLHLRQVRLGRLVLEGLRTTLRAHGDSLALQDEVRLQLLGGQVVLQEVTAQALLRPQRRLTLGARLYDLNLRRLDTPLPLEGLVSGEFSRLELIGDQLRSEGFLTLALAGGRLRLTQLSGEQLFSSLPVLRCTLESEQPLSLLQLTRLFPIGDISGTLHLKITDLTLVGGEVAAFHLDFAVAEEGGEPRAITVRALNNLLFATGSATVAGGLLGDTYRLPYRRFGAEVTLRNDVLRLRGKYVARDGTEYFMQAPGLGGGVSIVNRVPKNGLPFRDVVQRLRAVLGAGSEVRVK
ncbi:MAG: hypothetical protein KatS3mg131_0055 [Candidatus Tectimicrobiota bacterium]|nr:MAG: hypothetical protein KatS3mg131_0055 [Candidatus Tectomicrobia bacterium]